MVLPLPLHGNGRNELTYPGLGVIGGVGQIFRARNILHTLNSPDLSPIQDGLPGLEGKEFLHSDKI